MNLYVGNLNFGITENELRDFFNRYGKITAVTIIRGRYTNLSKGFGFVVMPNPLEAGQAIKQLDGTPLRERNIKASPDPSAEKSVNVSTFSLFITG
jgi:RNA recognition motif-containing protein